MKKFHIEIDIDKDGDMLIAEEGATDGHYYIKESMGVDDLIDQITMCLGDYLRDEYDDIPPHSEIEFWSNMSDKILGKEDLKNWQKEVMEEDFKKANDPVNHPSHYTDGKIEVIDFIEDKNLGFHLGNAVKYISRAGKKDPSKKLEDLKKARWYLDRMIGQLELERIK